MMRFRLRLRRMIAKSWILSRCYLRAARPSPFGSGERRDLVFLLWRQHAPSTFRVRRGIQALECCTGPIKGYRRRFNLDGLRLAAPLTRRKEYRGAGTAMSRSRPKIVMVGWSRSSRRWLRVTRWMESRCCGTSPHCGMAREPTDCPRPTSGFWRASSTCSE
jgi:hypothetical protein